MEIREVYDYFGSWYKMAQHTGLCSSNYYYWKKLGRIPFTAQLKIQFFTEGKLKAKLSESTAKEDVK